MKTNWRDFGIGMAAGVALCFILYFGWGLIHPQRPDIANEIAAPANGSVGIDENALIAANAERPNNSTTIVNPPPQLRPEPRNEPEIEPEPRPEPPVIRPRPRPDPDEDLSPPEEIGPDEDYGGKPEQ
jgi:hypothetical protein